MVSTAKATMRHCDFVSCGRFLERRVANMLFWACGMDATCFAVIVVRPARVRSSVSESRFWQKAQRCAFGGFHWWQKRQVLNGRLL